MTRKIRVLVVDDSAVMRRILTDLLSLDPAIEVVGAAADPYIARDKIRRLQPDVLTLDVEMPRMDGLTFLEKLMRSHPMPVVMVSALTPSGCDVTLRALELGAVNFVTKPQVGLQERMPGAIPEIVEKIREAAQARVRSARPEPPPRLPISLRLRDGAVPTQRVIAVGASVGGTEAIRELLGGMPADGPGIVIVQHMPERFTRSFAERCDRLSAMRVREAEDGAPVVQGEALIAPGGSHMRLASDAAGYRVRLDQSAAVNRHRPSVDVLFHSVAATAGSNAVGVILTGMGADGARGLLAMRRAGGRTIAEDEASCVVYGMPREAVALGAAEHVLPMPRIAQVALELAEAPTASRADAVNAGRK
ncbi:MAG TPA: chemotaxis response regulator protein-glutamate methylesterase [Methylomirabilota bacterium]|jgi:two-component system chemotaxis response regulator CheB|nr:chemotaxis response regulator protein-glutamate methylesterase [Methylomirabilota bacterium]